MKILHVAYGLSLNSGVSAFCVNCANEQAAKGHQVIVWTSHVPEMRPKENVRFICSPEPQLYDVSQFDVVHVHALWSLFLLRIMRACRKRRIPFVVSPHGSLMPRVFTKGRFKKWLTWHLLLRPIVRRAAAIHCTSEAERDACLRLGFKGPFVIAPLGVYLPTMDSRSMVGRVVPRPPQRTILFLGRLSEEKGLFTLLDAWKQLAQEGLVMPPTKLILAGPGWFDYKERLQAKVDAEQIPAVEFPGPVQGDAKDRLYRAADVFVLPSPMENFSMVVLDALAYGVPAIATKGTPWSELKSEHCGWWIGQGVSPLKDALRQALELSEEELVARGQRGRRLAERKYQWPAIAGQLITCYNDARRAFDVSV